MKLLLPLLLLLSAAAFADDGCDMWSHLEPTGEISCDWYHMEDGWHFICFNDYICVDNGCQIANQSDKPTHGRTKEASPIVSDRKRKR